MWNKSLIGTDSGGASPATALWRLGAIGDGGGERVVVEIGGRLFALGELLADDPTPALATLLGDWERWRRVLDDLVPRPGVEPLDPAALLWMPPVPADATVVCVGANYADHRREMGAGRTRPDFPYAFVKSRRSLSGHRRDVELPAAAEWVDWEGELAVVVGCGGRHLQGTAAAAAIAGFCQFNDVSARDWIEAGKGAGLVDMFVQKSFDGFGPVGPLLTPAHLVPDPQDLGLRLSVNGVAKQDSSTARMMFSVLETVEYVSSVMTLRPGDLIATGSPPGVGFAREPRERLRPGDVVTLQIEGLGPALESRFVAPWNDEPGRF
jgi:2,4-diketo-3-deoxy-L-fuconate hydrolase